MVKIKRLVVLKTAFFLGLFMAFMGLILGLLIAVMSSLVPISIITGPLASFVNGFWAILVLPIILGVAGFLSGLIFTPIMNIILKIIKGLDIELIGFDAPQETQILPIQPRPQTARQIQIPDISMPDEL